MHGLQVAPAGYPLSQFINLSFLGTASRGTMFMLTIARILRHGYAVSFRSLHIVMCIRISSYAKLLSARAIYAELESRALFERKIHTSIPWRLLTPTLLLKVYW